MDETAVSPVRFTPGPWQRIGTDIGTADGGKLAMACVENGNARDALKRMHANAALIAEAPAMYEALMAVVKFLEDDSLGSPGLSHSQLRALLARANGE